VVAGLKLSNCFREPENPVEKPRVAFEQLEGIAGAEAAQVSPDSPQARVTARAFERRDMPEDAGGHNPAAPAPELHEKRVSPDHGRHRWETERRF
jgi:hypothetical protein